MIINGASYLDALSADLGAPPDHMDEQSRRCCDPASPAVDNKKTSVSNLRLRLALKKAVG